jgi:hypothetical protein
MPKGFCAPPLCLRHRFNLGAAAIRFTIDGTAPGAAVNTLPDFADYNAQWQKIRAGLLRPIDVNCDTDCRCVSFGANPTIPNQPAPITLGEWETMDGRKVRWEVAGVTVDIWIGHCVPAAGKVKVGDGPWKPATDYPRGFGTGSSSGGKKKKKGKSKGRRGRAKKPVKRR